jgi:hypothetical protein
MIGSLGATQQEQIRGLQVILMAICEQMGGSVSVTKSEIISMPNKNLEVYELPDTDSLMIRVTG